MKTLHSLKKYFSNLVTSPGVNIISVRVLILGLILLIPWLFNYSWVIITTPYPAEYREGAILLMTDFFLHGINPFALENQPLMNNNYGFLYNLAVFPFATLFGNTLVVHRSVSVLFIIFSSALVVLVLMKIKVSLPFAFVGGSLLMACLLFSVTPLARPDALGEFWFLVAILLPWYRNFDKRSLVIGAASGVFAFLAKPYFLLSVVIVAIYVFVFVSKSRGLFYTMAVISVLAVALYVANILFESYFLGVVLSNAGNSILSNHHMWGQLTRFTKIFLPCLMIVILDSRKILSYFFAELKENFRKPDVLDFIHPDSPFCKGSMNYFGFFLLTSAAVVILLLGKHIGAYMTYFFQLIAPGLILSIFQRKNLLQERAMITVPLILSNLLVICFGVLYANQLSLPQRNDWDKLYGYVTNSDRILNSPVLVAEMVRLGKMPVDSGQSEYYYNIRPYPLNPFTPDYETVSDQGNGYLKTNQTAIQNHEYDYIIVTLELGSSPFVDRQSIDMYYDPIETINIAMPQSGQQWTIEVRMPKK